VTTTMSGRAHSKRTRVCLAGARLDQQIGEAPAFLRVFNVDSTSNVYVTGFVGHNAFKIQPVSQVPVLSNQGLAVLGTSLLCVVLWLIRRQRVAGA
jgi:hypothetical protein